MAYFETMVSQPWLNIIISAAVLFGALVAGFFLKIIVLGQVSRMAEKTSWKWDDPIVNNLRSAIVFWALILGLYFVKEVWMSVLPATINVFLNKLLIAGLGFSIILTVANIITSIISLYGEKFSSTLPLSNLTRTLVRILVFSIGGLVVLDALGVSITPLLTTLGIGGLAVALALQDTLANFFSGFYLTVSKNIKAGDYIKIESGEEGHVTDIGWRATKIVLLSNNVVIIPNIKMSQSIITNYNHPDKEVPVLIPVGVHYNSDLKYVEEVTVAAAKEIQQTVPGAVKDFQPLVRYNALADSSINFNVILRAQELVAGYLITHEFIKLLHQRYKEKGIVIPYPVRAINLDQEKAVLPK